MIIRAGVALRVTGRSPRDIFDLLMGLNRRVRRVCADIGLVRGEYRPPSVWTDKPATSRKS